MLSRRGRLVVFGAALAMVLIAAALLLSGAGDITAPDQLPAPVVSVPTHTAPVGAPARGPAPPATGAWVGAWVKPAVPTQAGEVSAVADFEHELGRPLDVVQVYHKWDDDFPSSADLSFIHQGRTVLLSWSGTDTRVITSGRLDPLIRARAEAIKAVGAPILLRWRWEMNRPNLQGSIWTPADYVAAWKHIRAIFTEVGATNAGWVWCPIATNFQATNGAAYYPGDDQVDWLCTDVYPGPDYLSFQDVSSEFLRWAAARPKPVLIGEYGAEDAAPGQRKGWLSAAAAFVEAHPQIKGLVYYDARHIDESSDRDFTLVPGTGPMQAFEQMAAEPYFDPRRVGG